jgi:hypothetical protein
MEYLDDIEPLSDEVLCQLENNVSISLLDLNRWDILTNIDWEKVGCDISTHWIERVEFLQPKRRGV